MRSRQAGRHDNRGLTIIELICAIAILGILATAVGSVLVASAKNYQSGTAEVNLQQEAQLAANQIADLVIDTTADVMYTMNADGSNTLEITKSDHLYVVTYKSTEMKLYYSEYQVYADGSRTVIGENQLLAEYVKKFEVDASSFAQDNTLQLVLGFEKDGRTYESAYTITARNGIVATSGSESAATITTDNVLVLEPNQVYELSATVVGTADPEVKWTVAGNTDTDTKVYKDVDGKWKIKVGKEERAASLTLLVMTNAKRSDGVTPLSQQTVDAKIRRVTGVSLTVSRLSGSELASGAVYQVTASFSGTNLDKVVGAVSDNDYIDPRKVDWNTIYTIGGKEVGGATWESWRDPRSQADCYTVSDRTDSSLTITLKRDFDPTSQLTVTAVAKHPEGVDPADSTVKTNKTGVSYGHVYATYTFQKSLINRTGAIIYRGSDVNQGNVDISALQAITNAMYSNNYWNQNDLWRKFRYREVITDPDTGSVSYGPWTNWLFTTVEGGVSFNIRPADTKRFEPNKDYEVEFKFEAHKSGAIIWPTADTDPEAYSFRGRIDHTKLAFSFPDLGITGACGISKDSPMTVNRNVTYNINYYSVSDDVIGIKYDLFQNELQVRAEKLVDGVWVEATAADCNLYIQGNIGQQHSVTFYTAGTYRLETGLKNQTHRTGNFSSPTDTVQNYWLGNAVTGDNYYYFNVN